jgi:acetoin utilization deacetylase AcuC-like enzyme
MVPIGFVYHEKFLSHDTGYSHPENHLRIERLYAAVREAGFGRDIDWIPARAGIESDLLLNHEQTYIDYVKKTCAQHEVALLDDGDTRVSRQSFEVGLLAVGAAIQAVDLVCRGHYQRVFVGCRPPGHHALRDHAMGFCLFNNVAIAAKYALKHFGIKRIMIIDWDVHHGNGTQDSFYADPRVLFCSIHQYPFYPGTGSPSEKGSGSGLNYTINIPVEAGDGIDAYRDAFRNVIIPSAEAFEPQLILISAGFDAHFQDPLAGVALRDEDFLEMTRWVLQLAESLCDGRLISVLEGGYHLDAMPRSVIQHLHGLMPVQAPALTDSIQLKYSTAR